MVIFWKRETGRTQDVFEYEIGFQMGGIEETKVYSFPKEKIEKILRNKGLEYLG